MIFNWLFYSSASKGLCYNIVLAWHPSASIHKDTKIQKYKNSQSSRAPIPLSPVLHTPGILTTPRLYTSQRQCDALSSAMNIKKLPISRAVVFCKNLTGHKLSRPTSFNLTVSRIPSILKNPSICSLTFGSPLIGPLAD